jgi:hypothetical protein
VDEATIIVPNAAAAAKKTPQSTPNRQAKAKGGRSKAPILALLAVLALVGAGAGAFFSGLLDPLLGPSYPLAQPFTLIVEKPKTGPTRAIGNMPSEDSRNALAGLVDQADITLSSGDIAESWAEDILATLTPLSDLQQWRLAVSNNQAKLSGITSDPDLAAALNAKFADGLPGGLDGTVQITYRLPVLAISQVRGLVGGFEDCGPLHVGPGSVGGGFGPEDTITVTGRLAGAETRVRMFDALRNLAESRRISLKVEILNPALCVVETALPKAPTGEINVAFSNGSDKAANPSGRFFVGENPVIDVKLPASITSGYLTVSILDVSGNVFHLLPNLSRQQNSIAELRGDTTGPLSVRVAYTLAESALNGGLAFRVDDSTLGKSRVLVLHSSEPLFAGLRPTSESAVGFAEALKENSARDAGLILSMDSKILETALP